MDKPSLKRGPVWAGYIWWRVNRYAKKHKLGNKVSNWGVQNCRYISGTTTWSQHAYGNALDIGVKDKKTGDKIVAFLKNQKNPKKYRFNIEHCLWQVPSHYDHIHIDFSPNYSGQPACAK